MDDDPVSDCDAVDWCRDVPADHRDHPECCYNNNEYTVEKETPTAIIPFPTISCQVMAGVLDHFPCQLADDFSRFAFA